MGDASAILLQSDQITIDGQTTFINSLKGEGFTTVDGINVTIRADGTGAEFDVGPTERLDEDDLVIGDMWINTATGKGNAPHT